MLNLNPAHGHSIAFASVISELLLIFFNNHVLTLHAVDV